MEVTPTVTPTTTPTVTPTETPAPATSAAAPLTPHQQALADIAANMRLVARSVSTKEPRHLFRAMRLTNPLRRRLNSAIIIDAVSVHFPDSHAARAPLISAVSKFKSPSPSQPQSTDVAMADVKETTAATATAESLVYLEVLAVSWMLDFPWSDSAEATAQNGAILERARDLARRVSASGIGGALDHLVARCWSLYSRAAERCGPTSLSEIRGELLAEHKSAGLRRLDETRATLLNLALRNLLAERMFEQAEKLVAKTALGDASSSNQSARYCYYVGRIRAVQLDYSGAHDSLMQALRKAPQRAALGFRLAAVKSLCIVQLLMGDIPERSVFQSPDMRAALRPYMRLTQAVRVGDLTAFRAAVEENSESFRRDGTLSLISRLRQTVIRTALRKISLSYSRISLADIASKVHIDSAEDCEFIVAKAIRDGVIDAVIDHDGGFMQSRENLDIYATQEPHAVLDKRIRFSLNIHNEALRSMRYAPDAHKPKPLQEDDDEARRLQEEAMKIEEEGIEEGDDGDF